MLLVFTWSFFSRSWLRRSRFSFLRILHGNLIWTDIWFFLFIWIILKVCPIYAAVFFHLATVLLHLLGKLVELVGLIEIAFGRSSTDLFRWSFSQLYAISLIVSYEIFALIFWVKINCFMCFFDTFLGLSSVILAFMLIVIIRIWKSILIRCLLSLLFVMR